MTIVLIILMFNRNLGMATGEVLMYGAFDI